MSRHKAIWMDWARYCSNCGADIPAYADHECEWPDVKERIREARVSIWPAIALLFVMLWLGLAIGGAFAQSHTGHPSQDQAIHEQFYSNWMMPDHPTSSCCNDRDCAPVSQVRQTDDGRWQAKRESDGVWLTIPAEKIEWNRDSPDGRSHMCSMGTTVFCFILGSGS